jgi:hypothetical protein
VARLAYKPFGLLFGVIGGVLAGAIFKRVWASFAGGDSAPSATDPSRGWGEILLAAGMEGALYGLVKAAVDRTGATGYQKMTGRWPDGQAAR